MVRLRLYPLTVPRLFEPMACARVMGIDQSLALRCLRPDMAFCGDLLRAAALIDEPLRALRGPGARMRSEEHTSELQSLMRISYAVFCLKNKTKHITTSTVRRVHI